MAKMKTYAVDVAIIVKTTLFVDARRPNGAAAKVTTEDGWRDAIRYHDDVDLQFRRGDARVVRIREIDL